MKIAAFIDGANLYAAIKQLDLNVDYKKLLAWLNKEGQLIRAFYYTALLTDEEYNPMRTLVDWLSYNGYTLVSKPAKEFTDGRGGRKIKGNMDVELTVDMMELAPNLDRIFLFSGDGDYRRLVEAVQRMGVRVSVVSTIRATNSLLADELRRQADDYIDLEDLRPFIERTEKPEGKTGTLSLAA